MKNPDTPTMADPFVPLCQRHNGHGSPAPEPHRVKVLTSSNANPAFEPLSTRDSADTESHQPAAHEPAPGSTADSPHSPHSSHSTVEPVLTVLREENTGRVIGVRIQCGCGQIMELTFDYPVSSAPDGPVNSEQPT